MLLYTRLSLCIPSFYFHAEVFWVVSPCSAVKVKVAKPSEMLLSYHNTAPRQNPEDPDLFFHRRENLKSRFLLLSSYTVNYASFVYNFSLFPYSLNIIDRYGLRFFKNEDLRRKKTRMIKLHNDSFIILTIFFAKYYLIGSSNQGR
jgi:hypothetical protein